MRAKGLERAVLVSDAIAIAGRPPGRYTRPGGQTLEITTEGRIQVADTPYLAGSGLRLHEGVANTVRFAGTSLAETFSLATRNPARVFGVDGSYGALAPGMAADLLLFRWDEAAPAWTWSATVAAGQVVYQAAPAA